MESSPENIIWANQQIWRMAVLPGFPSGEHRDIAITEYMKFMLHIARDREAFEWTITTAVSGEDRCPPPVYLREILERKFWPADRDLLPGMPGYEEPPLPE